MKSATNFNHRTFPYSSYLYVADGTNQETYFLVRLKMHLSTELALCLIWQRLFLAGGDCSLRQSEIETKHFNGRREVLSSMASSNEQTLQTESSRNKVANENLLNKPFVNNRIIILNELKLSQQILRETKVLKPYLVVGRDAPLETSLRKKRFANDNGEVNNSKNSTLSISGNDTKSKISLYFPNYNSSKSQLEVTYLNQESEKVLKNNTSHHKNIQRSKSFVDEKIQNYSGKKSTTLSPIGILKRVLKKESSESNTNKTSPLEHSRRFRELTERRKYSMNFVKSEKINNSSHLRKLEDDDISYKGVESTTMLNHVRFGKSNRNESTNRLDENILNETNIDTLLNKTHQNYVGRSKNKTSNNLNSIKTKAYKINANITALKSPASYSSNNFDTSEVFSLSVNRPLTTQTPLGPSSDKSQSEYSSQTLGVLLLSLLPTRMSERHLKSLSSAQETHVMPKMSATSRGLPTMLKPSPTLDPWPVKLAAEIPGDLILGGLMMVHEREDSVTCGPIMPQGGIQALETMLYTLDVINNMPGAPFTIGAHILDDCDKDTYGLEMAVDFIKGEHFYTCNILYHLG